MAQTSDEVVAACGSIVAELAPGVLGDRRLDARRDRVVAMLEQHPDIGFPDACVDDAATEALYRFLRNRRVGWEAILAPHVAATHARCAEVGDVLVIHDTTDMVFPGAAPRTGLTRLGPARHGFWVHTALAVSADGLRAPLGVLALHPFVRRTPTPGPRPPKSDRVRFADPTKESRCWADGVATVRAGLDATTRALHVMDRGADSYELFAAWVAQADRFLVRLTHDRQVVSAEGPSGRLTEAVAHAPVVCTRTVPLSRREGQRTLSARTLHPARAERVATLQISAQPVTLRRPPHVGSAVPATLAVHVVVVSEVAPPSDTTPVAWRLVTTEPIDTPAQIVQIVDAYRTRWMIEEYFKALKTGCAYEKRQLESLHTLLVALALLAPIAWRLLLLRHLAREQSSPPATAALTSQQIHVLRGTPPGAKLPPQPTVRDVVLALARLGGHLRQNGSPGWLTLARGFQKLCHIEQGWVAAMAEQEKM